MVFEPLPPSLAPKIASYAIQMPGKPQIQIENTQAEHRFNILNAWHSIVKPGTRVLELSCGQGTCTEVLAEVVGESGHVDAVDPGSTAPPGRWHRRRAICQPGPSARASRGTGRTPWRSCRRQRRRARHGTSRYWHTASGNLSRPLRWPRF